MVVIGDNSSAPSHLVNGVPQDPVLGPLLFSNYTSHIASSDSAFLVPELQYADDLQVYILSPPKFSSWIHRLIAAPPLCTPGAGATHYLLILANLSLFFLVLGNVLTHVTSVNVAGLIVTLADHVNYSESHSAAVFRSTKTSPKSVVPASTTYVHCDKFNLSSPAKTPNMIACSVVGLRLDYANVVLYGVSSTNIIRLQRIRNALANCVVADSNQRRGSNEVLQQLHWLPVR